MQAEIESGNYSLSASLDRPWNKGNSLELYEEMGLRAPAVEQLATLGETTRYDVGFGWLKEAGFAGQEMHWTLFVYRGDADDVGASVDLSGLGGEKVGRVEGVQTDRWRLGCAIAFI